MLTGIMAILTAIGNVIAKIIAFIPWWLWVCIAIFFLGGWVFYGGSCRDFACSKHHDPKPIKWQEMRVSSVITGASLECLAGRRDRRTKSVNLAYIAAPSESPLADESKSSLERLAGNTVRVPFQGILKKPLQNLIKPQGPVSATPEPIVNEPVEKKLVKCPDCDGIGEIWDTCVVVCYLCQRDPKCPVCNGLGRLRLSYDTIDQCETIISNHTYDIILGEDESDAPPSKCEECLKLHGPCSVLAQQLKDVIVLDPKKPKKIKCFECGGTSKHYEGLPEAQLIVGLIYSSYGQCLNTEQVRLGMAKLLSDAPKDWKQFENEAKKNNLGVWKKTNSAHRK